MEAFVEPLDSLINQLSSNAAPLSFWSLSNNIRFLIAIVMVGVICGAIGAQVVGNRMAFFSDALAHCAFAGFAVAFLLFLLVGITQEQFINWIMLIMILVGVGVGLLIAFVHDTTGLPSDTVIGVFFAGAIGLGAVFSRMARNRAFNIESFIFGDPLTLRTVDLLYLCLLLLVAGLFLSIFYNFLVLSSVNPSLAMSRNVPVRLCRYLFVVLLGLVVNLCLFVVGALLINALLIVPAATAANFCRNLKQQFWWSIGIALVCGIGGHFLSWELSVRFELQLGTGGTIVVLTVLLFIVSMVFGPAWRDRAFSIAQSRQAQGIA